MQNLKRFFKNGIILTLTSLLMRMLGVSFSAFVTEKLGAEGMGLYTLIMSVYGFTVTVASSGVSLAATRMCAEAGSRGEQRAALRRCALYAGVCGTIAAVGLFSGAELVAGRLLGDLRCTRSLRLLSLSMPFIALSNVLGGYFSAVRKVSRSAAAGIFEQLFRIFAAGWLLLHFVPDGIEYACMALVGGGALAEAASFVLSLILYLADRGRGELPDSGGSERRGLTGKLFSITLPVAAAAYIRSALTTLEHILIPRGLKQNPATKERALASYGILCGMAMPVVMLPTAFLYSFTGLLIPELAEASSRGETIRVRSMSERAAGLTIAYSFGCAAMLCAFSHEIGLLVYNSSECGDFIRIMAPLIPVMYFDHAVDSMLKGIGEQLYCMKVNILDAALCALLVYPLCSRVGIYGYVIVIYLSEVINAALSTIRLCRRAELCFSPGILLVPLAGGAAALLTAGLMPSSAGWGSLICRMTVSGGAYLLVCAVGGLVIPKKGVKKDRRLHAGPENTGL